MIELLVIAMKYATESKENGYLGRLPAHKTGKE